MDSPENPVPQRLRLATRGSQLALAQARQIADALEQARQNWPWLGPVLAVHWDSSGLDEDDPARGFALSETPLQDAFRQKATSDPVATIGRYPADHASGR